MSCSHSSTLPAAPAVGTFSLPSVPSPDADVVIEAPDADNDFSALSPAFSLTEGINAVSNGGTVSYGTTTAGSPISKTYTIHNTGTGGISITVSGLSLSATGFSSSFPSVPFDVASGATATFSVSLSATDPLGGVYSGSVTITHSASGGTFSFNVTGTVNAIVQALTVCKGSDCSTTTPYGYTLPTIAPGVSVTIPVTLTLRNTYPTAVTFPSSSFLAFNDGYTILTQPTPSSLNFGDTATLTLQFASSNPFHGLTYACQLHIPWRVNGVDDEKVIIFQVTTS
jgi:hypothetical protein